MKDAIESMKDEFAEMFADEKNDFGEMLNFGMEYLFWADSDDIPLIKDVTALGRKFKSEYIDSNSELTRGAELITPAGPMLIPMMRDAWVKADAVDIYRDALKSGEVVLGGENEKQLKAALLDRMIVEFDFVLGISNIILSMMDDAVIETSKTRLEIYAMMLRSVHYHKLLTDELVEIMNSGV